MTWSDETVPDGLSDVPARLSKLLEAAAESPWQPDQRSRGKTAKEIRRENEAHLEEKIYGPAGRKAWQERTYGRRGWVRGWLS